MGTVSGEGIPHAEGGIKAAFLAFEHGYKCQPTIQWTQNHSYVPIIIVFVYLVFVFYGQRAMRGRQPMKLKPAFAVWNLFLSMFSLLGASRLVPTLISALIDPNRGLHFSMCANPRDWHADGPAGLWLAAFIFSKIPELIDTIFLVLRGKKVIFLHWYHHATVMLYCWHALHTVAGPGIWFASMNYIVHAIMYGYYFCTSVGLYKLARPIAPLITTLQLSQMVGGTLIMCSCALAVWKNPMASSVAALAAAKGKTSGGISLDDNGSACAIDRTNLSLGLGMYLSYFALFAMFFVKKYCFSPPHFKGQWSSGSFPKGKKP